MKTRRTPFRFSRNTLVRRGVTALVIASLITVLGVLGLEVRHQLTHLANSASENVQWTLGQAETEIIALELATVNALHADADDDAAALDEVRLRFDIAYSRIETLQNAQVLADLRRVQDIGSEIQAALDFREAWVPVIDGSDEVLRAALPDLLDAAETVRAELRRLALSGIAFFARTGDERRIEISRTLSSIGLTTMVLVALLLVLIAAVLRLARQREGEAQANFETRRRMETIISTSLDAVVAVNRSNRIVEWNGAAERVFGYTRAEAIGADMPSLIVPPHFREMHNSGMTRYLAKGEPRVIGRGIVQLEARRKDGTIFPVDLSLAKAQAPAGEIFVAFLRDISDRMRSDEALRRARDRAVAGEKQKAELLAVMSHEMRTPLNGILGTLELLEADSLPAEDQRYLRIIRQSSEILLRHVNEVLDISRLDAGKMTLRKTRFDLVALLEEIVESQADRARAQGNLLTLRPLNPALHESYSDPDRLRQIMLNLVSNAIKFTAGGQITIEADCDSGMDECELRVIDTGVGIKPDDLERIFDDFVTIDSSYGRRNAGTGLGLGISQRLATALGGELGAESEPGDGSVFWLRLPLAPPADAPRTAPKVAEPPPAAPALPPLDVLLVEDNAVNREVAGHMLRRDGHRVTEATDGREGVRLAQAHDFDVILMDISMPGMDGIQASRAIRQSAGARAKAPIVATTAHAMPEEVRAFHDAGIATVLTKPISARALRQALASVLAAGALPDGADGIPSAGATGPRNAAPPDMGPELIDRVHLDELREELPEDKLTASLRTFAHEVEAFLSDLPIDGMAGIDTAAVRDLGAEAHRLAGSSGVFGALPMADALRTFERHARADDRTALAADAAALRTLWRDTRAALCAEGLEPSARA